MPYGLSDRAAALLETALPRNVARIQTDAFDVSRPEHLTYDGEPRPRYLRYVGAANYYRCDPVPLELQDNKGFLHFPNDANGPGGQFRIPRRWQADASHPAGGVWIEGSWEQAAPGPATPQNPYGGSWFMLEAQAGENDMFQLGAIHGNYADFDFGAAANRKAIYDHMHLRASEWYHPHHVLHVPSGAFAIDQTIVAKAGTIHLDGKREARDGAKSCLFFKEGVTWFIVHYDNTDGDETTNHVWVPPEGDRRSGSFSIFKGFGIFGRAAINKDYRITSDGIVLRGRGHVEQMWLSGPNRHGIHVATSISALMDNPRGEGNGYPGGNANSIRLLFNSVQWAGGSGIRCIGSDSNHVTKFGNETNFCGLWGDCEESFLGPNALIAHHTTDCGIGVGSTYCFGYQHEVGNPTKPGGYAYVIEDGVRVVYIARAPHQYQEYDPNTASDGKSWWQKLVDTKPGTNEGIWAYYGHDTNPGMNTPSWFAKEWLPNQPVGTYVPAGARYAAGVQNYSGSIFCYDEGSQPPNQLMTPRGMHRGNASGAFILKGASGDICDEGVDYGQRHFRMDNYNTETKRWESFSVHLAYNENGVLWADKASDSASGFQYGRAFEGGDLMLRTGLQPSQRVGAITGASSVARDGSGRTFDPGTHVFGRIAVATTYSYKPWEGTRIARRRTSQIGDGNSMFEGLSVGDVVLGVKDGGQNDPYNDFVPNGYGASVIVEAPDPRAAKKYLRFGQLGSEVLGSALPPPPPPPPVEPDPETPPAQTSMLFGRVDPSIATEDVAEGGKATKAASFGTHAKAFGSIAARSGVRCFEAHIGHVGDIGVGLATAGEPLGEPYLGSTPATSACLWHNGYTQNNTGGWSQGTGFQEGQVVRVTFNKASREMQIFVNGTLALTRTVAMTGDVYHAIDLRLEGDAVTLNLSPANLPAGVLAWDAPD